MYYAGKGKSWKLPKLRSERFLKRVLERGTCRGLIRIKPLPSNGFFLAPTKWHDVLFLLLQGMRVLFLLVQERTMSFSCAETRKERKEIRKRSA